MSVIVLASGGLDSAIVLRMAALSAEVKAVIFFNYGQVCVEEEFDALMWQCNRSGIGDTLQVVRLPLIDEETHLLATSDGLIHDTSCVVVVKEGRPISFGEAPSPYKGAALPIEVPYRNLIFLSYAFNQAAILHCAEVWGGFAFNPAAPIMDQHPDILSKFNMVMLEAYRANIIIHSPINGEDYSDVLQKARDYGVSPEHTWSCLNNLQYACGVCGKCTARLRAFKEYGVRDPAKYMMLSEVQECLQEGEVLEITNEHDLWDFHGLA